MKQIAARLGVAPSSVSVWVRDIDLTVQQRESLNRRAQDGRLAGVTAKRDRWALVRAEAREGGRALAIAGNPLHLAGCMLYWGEGAKSRTSVVLVNSDHELLTLFVRFLRECYGVTDDRIAVSCHIYPDLNAMEVEQFWLESLGLPESCLRKTTCQRSRASSGAIGKRRPLRHGTCSVAVHDVRIVQSIYGALETYVDRPLSFPT